MAQLPNTWGSLRYDTSNGGGTSIVQFNNGAVLLPVTRDGSGNREVFDATLTDLAFQLDQDLTVAADSVTDVPLSGIDTIGLPNGRAVAVYTENNATAADAIVFREYLNDGSAGAVTRFTPGGQMSEDPKVAVMGAGATQVIALTYFEGDDLKITTFDSNYQEIETDTVATRTAPPDESVTGADVAALGNGRFVISFVDENPASSAGDDVMARFYTPGLGLSASFFVDRDASNTARDTNVVALPDGTFVVAYTIGSDAIGVRYRVFDETGTPQMEVRSPLTTFSGTQDRPEIVTEADGTFVVFWVHENSDIRGQVISADGLRNIGTEFIAAEAPNGVNSYDAITLADGRIAISYNEEQASGNTVDVVTVLDPRDSVAAVTYGGRDVVVGSPEDEVLNFSGATENIRLIGAAGDDRLIGGQGNDILDGGEGGDVMSGGRGNDSYVVDSVYDVIQGEVAFSNGGGIDTVRSFVDYILPDNVEILRLGFEDGRDGIRGIHNDAPGTIVGNRADNILIGKGGNDQINGNNGNDTLEGGVGRDTLVGGIGDDTFVYRSVSESRAGAEERDVINGFFNGSSNDKIDLFFMDANAMVAGNQAWDFIGFDAFGGSGAADAGQLRLQSLGGPNAVLVEGDIRGDGVADFQIFVNLATVLDSDDFIL